MYKLGSDMQIGTRHPEGAAFVVKRRKNSNINSIIIICHFRSVSEAFTGYFVQSTGCFVHLARYLFDGTEK